MPPSSYARGTAGIPRGARMVAVQPDGGGGGMDLHPTAAIRLNLGAGRRRLDGYINVDLAPEPPPDIQADARALPLPDAYADEILAIHLLEHLYRWEAPA